MKEGKYDEAVLHYEKAVSMGMQASRERVEKARNLARGESELSPVQLLKLHEGYS